jgi:uncharacterized RDD family membrane protein YckC
MICRNHVDVSMGVRRCARCGSPFCSDCLVHIQGSDYCAVCKNEQIMDMRSGTAEVLELASVGRRFAALWIDQFLLIVAVTIAAVPVVVMSAGQQSGVPAFFIAFFFIAFFGGFVTYEAVMLTKRGQTLGKMAMKVRVVRPDGTPISSGQAWGRALTRMVMVHVLALINYLPAIMTKEKTAVHDMLAKTRVVNAG